MTPEWQPIETAPRDGTEILIARYVDGSFLWAMSDRWTDGDHGPGWVDAGPYEPTHWMPLPPILPD